MIYQKYRELEIRDYLLLRRADRLSPPSIAYSCILSIYDEMILTIVNDS